MLGSREMKKKKKHLTRSGGLPWGREGRPSHAPWQTLTSRAVHHQSTPTHNSPRRCSRWPPQPALGPKMLGPRNGVHSHLARSNLSIDLSIYLYIFTYIFLYIYIYIYVNLWIYTHRHTHIYVYIYMCVCAYIYIYIECIYIYKKKYLYIHTYLYM